MIATLAGAACAPQAAAPDGVSPSGGKGGRGAGGQAGAAGRTGAGGTGGTAGGFVAPTEIRTDASPPKAGTLDAGPGADAAEPGNPGEPPEPADPFAISPAAVPAPWSATDVGAVGMKGAVGRGPRRYEVKGAGADIWGTADAFHFLHRKVAGDVEIVAKLAGQQANSPDARAGVMLRESTAADARNVFMTLFPALTDARGVLAGKGTRLQYRDKRTDLLTGYADLAALAAPRPDAPPVWLRLVRKGPLFAGYFSGDGSLWIKDGEVTIPGVPGDLLAGLAVTAHNVSDTSVGHFEGVRVTALSDASWTHTLLGTLGGYAGGGPGKLDLEAVGAGFANKKDALAFVHRTTQHTGDIEITARVTALSSAGTSAARVGFMLRSGLEPGARMAAFVVELGPKGQRTVMIRRAYDDGNITSTEGPKMGAGADIDPEDAGVSDAGAPRVELAPVGIKLVRLGNRFVGLINPAGRGGYKVAVDVPGFVISANTYVGVIASAGTEEAITSATVEELTISGAPTAITATPLDAGSD